MLIDRLIRDGTSTPLIDNVTTPHDDEVLLGLHDGLRWRPYVTLSSKSSVNGARRAPRSSSAAIRSAYNWSPK